MAERNFITNRFETTGEQAKMVREWSGRYQKLIDRLGENCTPVIISRMLEHDADIEPHNFIRDAFHLFVYPPQPVKLEDDRSTVIDSTPGYKLATQIKKYGYDESLVEGRITVNYDDAESAINFSIIDDLPEEAQEKVKPFIDAAFAVEPSIMKSNMRGH